MKLKILKDNFEPIDIEDINLFEDKIGYSLPIEYKNFLLENNGAICRKNEFKFKEPNEFYKEDLEVEIKDFCNYCNVIHASTNHKYFDRETSFYEIISLKDLNEIFGVTEDINNPDRKYIIIMISSGSEAVYISLNKETFGHIYFSDQRNDGIFIHLESSLINLLQQFED